MSKIEAKLQAEMSQGKQYFEILNFGKQVPQKSHGLFSPKAGDQPQKIKLGIKDLDKVTKAAAALLSIKPAVKKKETQEKLIDVQVCYNKKY